MRRGPGSERRPPESVAARPRNGRGEPRCPAWPGRTCRLGPSRWSRGDRLAVAIDVPSDSAGPELPAEGNLGAEQPVGEHALAQTDSLQRGGSRERRERPGRADAGDMVGLSVTKPIRWDTRNAVRLGVPLCPTSCPIGPECPMAEPNLAGIIIRVSGVRVPPPASRQGPFQPEPRTSDPAHRRDCRLCSRQRWPT
jgi:hypothetical protein